MAKRFIRSCVALAIPFIVANCSLAADFFNPDNGHYYRRIPRLLTWEDARAVAFRQVHDGIRGHLPTITTAAEQDFIESIALPSETWLGGFQPEGSPEPDGNWQWVTGEPFAYANWFTQEPNNYLLGESRIELLTPIAVPGGYARLWNDIGPLTPNTSNHLLSRSVIVEFTPGFSPQLNAADFLNWQLDLGNQGPYLRADFNGDGLVDRADLDVWYANSSVPEPATIALVVAFLGTFVRERSRRS